MAPFGCPVLRVVRRKRLSLALVALRQTHGGTVASVKLFHYTSRDTALEHILPTGRLRFGRLPRTNDPREFAPISFGIVDRVDENDQLTTRNPSELIEEADALLRDSVHVLCLTEDRRSHGGEQRGYGNGPRRARMWAQYAANHTGVCLCFDGKRLIGAAEDQLGGPGRTLLHAAVDYLPEGEYPRATTLFQPRAEQDLKTFIENLVGTIPWDLFFAKDWDWNSETEYRFLLRGDTQDEEFIDVRGALEAVIVGQRFHPVYRPGLYKLCKELEIDPLQIQWEMGLPFVVRILDPGDRRLTDAAAAKPE